MLSPPRLRALCVGFNAVALSRQTRVSIDISET